MVIKHTNIIYVRNINAIGGVETYAYELVKKYKDYDIAVVCKGIAPEQKKRIEKYCRVYIHKNEKIECKIAIINWDTSIIDYINKDAKIYQGIHADYTHPSQGSIPQDDRITCYLAITEDIRKNFIKLTHRENVILCRNPLEIEKDEKYLTLISATRLTAEKGGNLMLKLADKLDELGIDFIWYIFTTNEYNGSPIWKNKNVVHMNNRLDVGKFMAKADWLIQPSECEGDSYTLKEALYRGIGIVARELKYFKEIGIEEDKNALFINDDNVEDIAKKMLKPLKFTFKQIEDGYKNIMVNSVSRYEEEKKMKVKVKCIQAYRSTVKEEGDIFNDVKVGDVFEVSRERADILLEAPALVEILEETKATDESVETSKETKKENKKKKDDR